jgi:antitoxin HicB
MSPNDHWGSTLDDLLKEDGVFDAFKAQAEKEAVVWQLKEAMTAQRITKKRLAELMRTSRTQVDKLLDPAGNVTLETLHKAAAAVGKRVEVRLVEAA